MKRKHLTKACVLWVVCMGIFSLPKLAFAHPGHSVLTSLVADAVLGNSSGCNQQTVE